jgi:hypothetical protein
MNRINPPAAPKVTCSLSRQALSGLVRCRVIRTDEKARGGSMTRLRKVGSRSEAATSFDAMYLLTRSSSLNDILVFQELLSKKSQACRL